MHAEFRLKRILITRAIRKYKFLSTCAAHSPENEPNVHLYARFGDISNAVETGGWLSHGDVLTDVLTDDCFSILTNTFNVMSVVFVSS